MLDEIIKQAEKAKLESCSSISQFIAGQKACREGRECHEDKEHKDFVRGYEFEFELGEMRSGH